MRNLFDKSKSVNGYLFALGGVALATLLLSLIHERINPTADALALLLVVLVTATIFGSRPALLASFAGVLAFNFFFLPPFYTFTIADPQNWVAFASFLITAVIAGQLSSYARRRAEESEQRRGEIERLYEELQAAFEQASQAEALRRSEQLKSALLDAVTHDLRTPLTSIKASATTLREDLRGSQNETEFSGDNFSGSNRLQLDYEGRREFLDVIIEESDRLDEFIEGMVSLARVEADNLHLRKSWTSIEDVIKTALKRAKYRLASFHITVEIERELPAVLIDASSITEAIYTLLDNAAKYSSEQAKIRILARRTAGDAIEIAVEDCGAGISSEMREKVFDKFFRAGGGGVPNTADGLGLGLAIARGIVESQGGKIWIEDGRDEYKTRAAFRIPIGDNGK